MKVTIISVGKTNEPYLETGISAYLSRLNHYLTIVLDLIPAIKNKSLPIEIHKKEEGKIILEKIHSRDFVILLDEKGNELTSNQLALFLNSRLNYSSVPLCFIIGGAYGVSEDVRKRADFILSLSKMTFSHQMVRLFFVEQLYRAMTILKGEKYHNQ